jgi:Uma2 family endonuclease
VVCDPNKIDKRGCIGAPDFIVEILSESTSSKDQNEKYDLYEENGVKEYWIINPETRLVFVYVLENERYKLAGQYDSEARIQVGVLPGYSIAYSKIFNKVV